MANVNVNKANELKGKFIEAVKASKEMNCGKANEKQYSFKMLQALRDMAKADVYPDGNFGDDDCCVWEMFRSMKW